MKILKIYKDKNIFELMIIFKSDYSKALLGVCVDYQFLHIHLFFIKLTFKK